MSWNPGLPDTTGEEHPAGASWCSAPPRHLVSGRWGSRMGKQKSLGAALAVAPWQAQWPSVRR